MSMFNKQHTSHMSKFQHTTAFYGFVQGVPAPGMPFYSIIQTPSCPAEGYSSSKAGYFKV